ncbi:TPA: hypothetical protein ACQ301_004454 [Yersinia enterocolitica]
MNGKILFIEIELSHKAIPKLIFKGDRQSGVIKKAHVRKYSNAQALLVAIEGQVHKYQEIIEQQTIKMIEDKEDELNEEVRRLQTSCLHQLVASKQEWFEKAEIQLKECIDAQEMKINKVIDDVANRAEISIRNKLISMNQAEELIGYLTDALHSELNDVKKSLVVVQTYDHQGVTLTIENEDGMVTVNTQEILLELQSCLDTKHHD